MKIINAFFVFIFVMSCALNANAKCTEEQISKMIVNNISQKQIDKVCSEDASNDVIQDDIESTPKKEKINSYSDLRNQEPICFSL